MDRQSVVSSNIAAIGYDDESSTLEIEFTSGGIYQYSDVPRGTYDDLMSASSHGIYFHQNIKGQYDFEKVA